MVERYEQLRSVALASGASAHELGLGLMMARGLPAWMRAWRELPTPVTVATTIVPVPAVAASSAVAAVLTAMAIGLLQHTN